MKISRTTLALICALTAGCAATKTPAPAPTSPPAVIAPKASAPAASAPSEIHGIDPADLDPSVSACTNLNLYGNGGWLKAHPIPADQSYWGSFSLLFEENRNKLHTVLEKAAASTSSAPGSDVRKVGDFWASCMDEGAIEAAGIQPLRPELEAIQKIATPADLQSTIARLQGFSSAVFHFTAEQDRRNSSEVIAIASQGGLGLPDREYYTKTDEASRTLRGQYAAHMTKMFELLGDAAPQAAANAKTVMAIETRLAEASMKPDEARDSEKTYNRMDPAALAKLTPNFSWTEYFRQRGVSPAAVNVAQPKFFETVNKELRATPIPEWKTYLRWHLIHSAAPDLSKAFVDEDFAFYGKTLQGTPENEARWKRCVVATDAALGQALGKAYVHDYFPPAAKASADAMVKNLLAALRDDLKTLPWMGEATRAKALDKLALVRPKIGYPDVWRDYSKLAIDRGPYVLNSQRAEDFESQRLLGKVGKPVDREDWQMTPPEVNAYYDPQLNEIVFPAGILQPPFFDPKADDAVNYGAMGAVIGHELTHGFDDEGRKFDARGNMSDWWTAEDAKNYEARAKCVEDQFSAYKFEDQNVNGKLVLGESIADLGGLGIAYRAYRGTLAGKPEPASIDGLSGNQRFYLAWARVWSANVRPELSRLLMNTNPHPLPELRANGAPSNLPSFATAFSCKAGDAMVRKETCQIW
ncbi:MAG: M13 family metallopeptidase [Thermoanaerobaculia bacterium]